MGTVFASSSFYTVIDFTRLDNKHAIPILHEMAVATKTDDLLVPASHKRYVAIWTRCL